MLAEVMGKGTDQRWLKGWSVWIAGTRRLETINLESICTVVWLFSTNAASHSIEAEEVAYIDIKLGACR